MGTASHESEVAAMGALAPAAPVDVGVLREEIAKTYTEVSIQPDEEFIFPTGRAWARELAYPAELENLPDATVDGFAGVANPWSFGYPQPGETVLDLGCGTWTDLLIAAQMVGPADAPSGST